MSPAARKAAWTLVSLAVLAATFAWYFAGQVPFDLARLWATCFGP